MRSHSGILGWEEVADDCRVELAAKASEPGAVSGALEGPSAYGHRIEHGAGFRSDTSHHLKAVVRLERGDCGLSQWTEVPRNRTTEESFFRQKCLKRPHVRAG